MVRWTVAALTWGKAKEGSEPRGWVFLGTGSRKLRMDGHQCSRFTERAHTVAVASRIDAVAILDTGGSSAGVGNWTVLHWSGRQADMVASDAMEAMQLRYGAALGERCKPWATAAAGCRLRALPT